MKKIILCLKNITVLTITKSIKIKAEDRLKNEFGCCFCVPGYVQGPLVIWLTMFTCGCLLKSSFLMFSGFIKNIQIPRPRHGEEQWTDSAPSSFSHQEFQDLENEERGLVRNIYIYFCFLCFKSPYCRFIFNILVMFPFPFYHYKNSDLYFFYIFSSLPTFPF